jgi:transcriptional regulator with XRE-family HTH domain
MQPTPNEKTPNRFREALTRKGWTVERGAAETGYSPSYFAMMLREPRLMSEQMARRVADVLGVDLPPMSDSASRAGTP